MTASSSTNAPVSGLAPMEWAIVAALAVVLAPGLVGLAGEWMRHDYLSHGFLIPVVSLWIWMRERPRRDAVTARRAPVAVVVLGLALLAYAAGLLSAAIWLHGVALVVAVAATVWWFRGFDWVRVGAFPLGFLIFMVPPPSSWTTPLIVRLQIWVSVVAVDTLNLLGESVRREGNIMELASGEALFVAEACSGVTSVITLAPLGMLLAYLTLKTTWARASVVASVIPLAMAGNLARVVLTAMLAERYGARIAAEGPPHLLLGLVTYVVGVGLLIGFAFILHRIEQSRG